MIDPDFFGCSGKLSFEETWRLASGEDDAGLRETTPSRRRTVRLSPQLIASTDVRKIGTVSPVLRSITRSVTLSAPALDHST